MHHEDIANRLDQYIVIIGFVRKVTNKPIILCEFGYIGYGNPKPAYYAVQEAFGNIDR